MRRIRLGYNAVPDSARRAVLDVFDSGQFSPGKRVREFEERWAALHQAKHAIFVNSGTDALRLSLLALKEKYQWQEWDQVAVPALTFVATVNVIIQSGLSPFFVDIKMGDYTLNPDNLDWRMRTGKAERLRAMIPVHLFGKSCGDGVYEVAKKYGLKVLEDSCETIANPLRGEISCYSTYMAHHVTTGVGGFAVMDDDGLNGLIRSYANHGRDRDYLPGYRQKPLSRDLLKKRFTFERSGYSCRGTEFEAALGLSQLKSVSQNIARRREVVRALGQALYPFWPDVSVLTGEEDNHTFMMFPVMLKEDSGVDKYDLCLALEKAGIETRDMMPITNQPCFRHLVDEDNFSVAKSVNERGFYIPCHPGMTEDDVAWVGEVFQKYLSEKLQKV